MPHHLGSLGMGSLGQIPSELRTLPHDIFTYRAPSPISFPISILRHHLLAHGIVADSIVCGEAPSGLLRCIPLHARGAVDIYGWDEIHGCVCMCY